MRLRPVVVVAIATLGCATLGCSSTSSSQGPLFDALVATDAPSDVPPPDETKDTSGPPCVDPMTCGAPPQCAPSVQTQLVADVAKTPSGGVLADGTYALVALSVHTGVGGKSGPGPSRTAETFTYAGGSVHVSVVAELSGSAPTTTGISGTYAFEGATLKWAHDCPDTNRGSQTFTVDADGTFHLFEASGGSTIEFVFKRTSG